METTVVADMMVVAPTAHVVAALLEAAAAEQGAELLVRTPTTPAVYPVFSKTMQVELYRKPKLRLPEQSILEGSIWASMQPESATCMV